MTDEERVSRIQAFIFNGERLLGAKSGSMLNIMEIFGIEN